MLHAVANKEKKKSEAKYIKIKINKQIKQTNKTQNADKRIFVYIPVDNIYVYKIKHRQINK